KTLHVFVVGVGNIGKELLKQINDHHEYLVKNNLINIKIIGLTNSKKMLVDAEGLDLSNWEAALAEKGEVADLGKFIEQMKALNLPNCVFVDNTASPYPST